MNTQCPMCGAQAHMDGETNPKTGNIWQDNKAWCSQPFTCGWAGYVYELWDGE